MLLINKPQKKEPYKDPLHRPDVKFKTFFDTHVKKLMCKVVQIQTFFIVSDSTVMLKSMNNLFKALCIIFVNVFEIVFRR